MSVGKLVENLAQDAKITANRDRDTTDDIFMVTKMINCNLVQFRRKLNH